MDEFTRYTTVTLGSEEYNVTLKGRGGIQQPGLPKTHIDYDKTITLKGKEDSLHALSPTHY